MYVYVALYVLLNFPSYDRGKKPGRGSTVMHTSVGSVNRIKSVSLDVCVTETGKILAVLFEGPLGKRGNIKNTNVIWDVVSSMCEMIILCNLFQFKRKPDLLFHKHSLNNALTSLILCNPIS